MDVNNTSCDKPHCATQVTKIMNIDKTCKISDRLHYAATIWQEELILYSDGEYGCYY